MNDIQRIGVVGCGVMGSGIAELCALNKLDVCVVGRTNASIDAGRVKLVESLTRAVRKERITVWERDAALARISFATELQALADRHLVIESVRENESTKRAIFEILDQVVRDPDAILTSNTSSIPVIKLGRATTRAANVLGTHFFNPAPVMPLVELVETLLSDKAPAQRLEWFLTEILGKHVVRTRDRAGFLVNKLFVPYLLSAIRMVESGFASAADIDKAMTLGCAHPMGPLALVDLIGLDTIADIADALHREFQEPRYTVPPLLSRMVDAGLLGKKVGMGFHRYDHPTTAGPAQSTPGRK